MLASYVRQLETMVRQTEERSKQLARILVEAKVLTETELRQLREEREATMDTTRVM